MGLPRLSVKRCFIYMFCATGMILVVMNVRQRELWNTIGGDNGQSQAQRLLSYINNKIKTLLSPKSKWMLTVTPQIKSIEPDESTTRKVIEPLNVTGTTSAMENVVDNFFDPSKRPWYMNGGTRRPLPAAKSKRTGRRIARLWPDEDPHDDRITNQLMFVPPNYNRTSLERKPKKIMVSHGMTEAKTGNDLFLWLGCPVNTCVITRDNAETADLILFKDYVSHVSRRSPNQIWLLYFLECPYHTQTVKNAVVNWTATYRTDSDIVAPYERWQYYDPRVTQISQTFNYAANKTKKVAWFVSNCHPRNNRMQYVKDLSKYIEVDIYGVCGSLRCPRSQAQTCFEMLDADYKFYLAFENSNCRDYITEKFFVNGLGHNVLPIVMGAHPNDYAKSAPYRSYIHVDEFESPRELAEYLHRLDNDDELYNSYFKWKGTGEFINTYFWCRVCAMLHDERSPKYYEDVNEWWRGDDICTQNSWREYEEENGL